MRVFCCLLLLVSPALGAEEDSPWFATAQVAGTVFHLNDEGEPYRFSLGAGRSFTPWLDGMADLVYSHYQVNAVNDRNPGVYAREGESGSLGFDLRLRALAFRTGAVGWYAQGGAGVQVMLNDPPFPADGSRENFTLMLGPGCLIDLSERWRLAVTVQWFHISNARMRPNNSGYDGVQLVVSPEWRF